MALQLGRTPEELRESLTVADKVELMAWCRINGPLPILRPDYYAAQLAALIHNTNLSEKTSHKAKGISDFLLWGDKPDQAEAEVARAMSKLGIARKRNGNK